VAVHTEELVILACVVLTQCCSVTDRRTDGRPDDGSPKTREYAVARKNR